jgi:subtilisin family serine protease
VGARTECRSRGLDARQQRRASDARAGSGLIDAGDGGREIWFAVSASAINLSSSGSRSCRQSAVTGVAELAVFGGVPHSA